MLLGWASIEVLVWKNSEIDVNFELDENDSISIFSNKEIFSPNVIIQEIIKYLNHQTQEK